MGKCPKLIVRDSTQKSERIEKIDLVNQGVNMFLREYLNRALEYKVVIEDDDRVAYAYLLKNDSIVGDVWLYNSIQPGDVPGWESNDEMPYLNPSIYSLFFGAPISDNEDINVKWRTDFQETMVAEIFIRNQLHAILKEGEMPGWCRLAADDGPLAKVLK